MSKTIDVNDIEEDKKLELVARNQICSVCAKRESHFLRTCGHTYCDTCSDADSLICLVCGEENDISYLYNSVKKQIDDTIKIINTNEDQKRKELELKFNEIIEKLKNELNEQKKN